MADIKHANTACEINNTVTIRIPDNRVFSTVRKLRCRAGGTISDIFLFKLIQLCIAHLHLLHSSVN